MRRTREATVASPRRPEERLVDPEALGDEIARAAEAGLRRREARALAVVVQKIVVRVRAAVAVPDGLFAGRAETALARVHALARGRAEPAVGSHATTAATGATG